MKLSRIGLIAACFAALALSAQVADAQVLQGTPPNSTDTQIGGQTKDHVAFTGGAMDGVTVGGTTPAAGQFAPLYGGGTTTANASLQAPTVTSAVNEVVVSGAATGSAPSVAVGGSGADANANLNVAGAGTGIVTLGQAICTVTGATPQTCNGQRGIVTTGTLTTAAVTAATYVINNSSVASTSLLACQLQAYSGTYFTNGLPEVMDCKAGSGTITVDFANTHGTNALNGTLKIGFVVLN